MFLTIQYHALSDLKSQFFHAQSLTIDESSSFVMQDDLYREFACLKSAAEKASGGFRAWVDAVAPTPDERRSGAQLRRWRGLRGAPPVPPDRGLCVTVTLAMDNDSLINNVVLIALYKYLGPTQ
jgi:hypothetical protein